MGRGGAASSRGRGKFKNFSRGGGRHFSRDLDPRNAARQINGESSSEEEDSDEEEESEDEAQGPASEPTLAPEMAALNLKLGNTVALDEPEVEMSRAERKAMKKAQATKKVQIQEPAESDSEGSEEVDDLLNPPKQAGKKQDVKPKAKAPAAPELSRKEREAAEKKAAAERYAKLHAQGKTTEAKSDLARLQEVRRRREAAAAQRQAEADEAAKEAAAKKEKASARKL